MKIQRLITSTALGNFNAEVNKLLAEGWKVVPGTLIVAVRPLVGQAGQYHQTVDVHHACAVVLERNQLTV